MNVNVIGSGLDSLITSFLLLEKGHEVTLYSGGNKLAGHFAGLKNEHTIFDAGMVLLEKEDRGETQEEIITYNNEFGYKSRKFLLQTFLEIQRILGECEPAIVKTLLSNKIEVEDYFISDNLNAFNYLDGSDRVTLIGNLENILEGKNPKFTHPKFKWNTDCIRKNSVSFNLELMYGEKIYRQYFGKFLYALTGSSDVSMPMRFHRKVWIPLYYPESLLSHIKKSNFDLPSVQFFKFKRSSIALAIKELILKIDRDKRFKLINTPVAELNKEAFRSKESIYFLPIDDLSRLFPHSSVHDFASQMSQLCITQNTNQIRFLHLCVSKLESKTVFLQDPVEGLFRYSINNSPDNNLSIACFEFGSGAPNSMDEMVKISNNFLRPSKILCAGQVNSTNYAQKFSTMGMGEWESRVSEVCEYIKSPSSTVNITHPDALSFNDNVVRGLAAASRIE